MAKSIKLTATIITLNEERDLPRCLKSVKSLADEIVIVDSESTDKTVEIAREFGAKVYYRKFDNYSNQKNYAARKASGDWVLAMDADEEIPPELGKEIKKAIKSTKFDGYSMPRKNIIFGKFIKYTRWQPEFDRQVWLWKKEKGRWVRDVHEELEVNGEIGKLRSAKLHCQYKNVNEFMKMMNHYSELDANQRVKDEVNFSYSRLVFDPIYNFLVRYFYRWGFLDGWRGFVLSYLMAIYHIELWVKVWEKGRTKSVN